MSEERQGPPRSPESSDRLLDHQYDGIQEYDNPMPRWWVYIFWATIIWSLLYFINVPGIGTGKGRIANYRREMDAAQKKFASVTGPALTDEALWAIAHDPGRLAEGEAQFKSTCAVCHRADGGGQIGPNLTDAYWIHGARPTEVLRSVSEGVLDKGMPAWDQVLKPQQVSSVVGYVLTLRGTHPDNPKEPQGVNADSAAHAGVPPAAATENLPAVAPPVTTGTKDAR